MDSQGLDITDEGYSLTKGWFSLHGRWKDNVDITWLSSVIGGLWLSIIGEPSVLWGRIGYAIVISLTSTFAFLILKLYFKTTKTFIVVSLVTIFYTLRTFLSISYYILPILLVLLSILLLLKYINSRNKYLLIAAGFIFVIAGFVKCTFLITPVLYLVYLSFFLPDEKNELKPVILNSLIGISCGYILGVFLLIVTGSFKIYVTVLAQAIGLISSPFPTSDSLYIISALFLKYSENFYQLFSYCLIGINILFIYLLSISYLKTNWLRFLLSLMFTYFIYSVAKHGDSEHWEYIAMTFGFTFLFVHLIDKKSNKQLRMIIILSVLIFVLSFLGSNNGFITGFQSGGMLMLLSGSVLICDDVNLEPSSLVKIHSLKYLKYIFFGFLILVFIWKKPDDVHRERPRHELKVPFSSAHLKGIFSSSPRVNSIDSLIIAYDDIKKKNKEEELSTLAINSNPLFYFLEETKPYLANPLLTSIKEFENKLLIMPEPEFFIFSIQNPRNLGWPMSNSKPCDGPDSLDYKYFMSWVLKNNYMSAYKNKMFQIYAKPGLLFRTDPGNILNNKTNKGQTPNQWQKLRPNCNVDIDNTDSLTIAFEITNFLKGGTGGSSDQFWCQMKFIL